MIGGKGFYRLYSRTIRFTTGERACLSAREFARSKRENVIGREYKVFRYAAHAGFILTRGQREPVNTHPLRFHKPASGALELR
jgi:hypothetical protein